jgi:hypothetical protein
MTAMKDEVRLLLFALAGAAAVLVLSATAPDGLGLIVAGVVAAVGFITVALRWPIVFFVLTIFMPQWKGAAPLNRITFVDLTLVSLCGLILGFLWMGLKHLSGLQRLRLSKLFRGQRWPLLAYFGFCVIVATSYAYTDSPQYGASKLFRFVLIGTLFLVSGLLLIRSERDFRRFSLLFVACACVTSVQMILHLERRAADAQGDITRIGAGWLLGMSILLLVCYPLIQRRMLRMVTVSVCLLVLIAGLVASAARGPSLVLAVVLPLTYYVFTKHRFAAAHAVAALLLVGFCAASYLYMSRFDPDKYSGKTAELTRLSSGKTGSGSAAKRLDYYRRTLLAIPDHLLFGEGVGSWSFFYYGADRREYPHNLFLETSFEEGLFGQLLLFGFLILMAYSIRENLRVTNHHFGVLAGILLFCVLVSMFSGDLDDNRILWGWSGIILAICRNTSRLQLQRQMIRVPLRMAARNLIFTEQPQLKASEHSSALP